MAVEAPPHVERLRFARQRHLIDPTMTSGAANSFGYVHTVIEIDVTGQIIYPHHFSGLPVARLSRSGASTRVSVQSCE